MSKRPTDPARFARAAQALANVAVLNATTTSSSNGTKAAKTGVLYLYGAVGGWWSGFSADSVLRQLKALDGVAELHVHLHSPGGDVLDGVAIHNQLVNFDANVTVFVDGVAASAASYIAMAADEIVMGPGTQLMIHDALSAMYGNATDMRDLADFLDKQSQNIAGFYAARAGGSADDWRKAMKAETWYTADEAVTAGLADRTAESVTEPADAETAIAETEEAFSEALDDFLRAAAEAGHLAYAGRNQAPAPKPPSASPRSGSTTQQEETAMAFSPEQLTTMRQELGLAETADEATIVAALSEALAERADAPASTPPAPAPAAPAAPVATQEPAPAAPATPAPVAAGTMVIDSAAWEEQQNRIRSLEADATRRRREERDQVIAQANRDGKFPPSRNAHWARLWDNDADGTRAVIDGLTKNVIPVELLGNAEDGSELDDEFAHLYPPTSKEA